MLNSIVIVCKIVKTLFVAAHKSGLRNSKLFYSGLGLASKEGPWMTPHCAQKPGDGS